MANLVILWVLLLISSGNIYVIDFDARVQKFTSAGVFIIKWGSPGSGDGQFFNPSDIAVDSSGNIYVADYGNSKIQKFTNEGVFLGNWGGRGFNDSQVSNPEGIAVDKLGNIYVADTGNNRVQKFASSFPSSSQSPIASPSPYSPAELNYIISVTAVVGLIVLFLALALVFWQRRKKIKPKKPDDSNDLRGREIITQVVKPPEFNGELKKSFKETNPIDSKDTKHSVY